MQTQRARQAASLQAILSFRYEREIMMQSLGNKAIRRVLIADDDPVVRHWLTTILESDHYTVVSISDGRAAFRIMKDDADFVGAVLDLSMPYLEGPDLIRYMRTEKRLMKIPVLIITAETAINAITACFSAGATIVLPKPFTKQRLQQTLRMMLNDSSIGKRLQEETASCTSRKSLSNWAARQSASEANDDTPAVNQAVDLSILDDLAGTRDSDDNLVVELIDLFLENTTSHISEIKNAIETKKPQLLKQTAHALKGSSLTIGARDIGGICQEIEQEQIGSVKLVDLLAKLDAAFASAREVFQRERANRAVPVAA